MAQPIWTTQAGSIGTFPFGVAATYQLVADPVAPATTLSFAIISGTLPDGLAMSSLGLITGTPTIVARNVSSAFTVRATDDLGNIRDRTFSILISGTAIPQFETIEGELGPFADSTWVEFYITYTNPIPTNVVLIELIDGELPPGLELTTQGLIQGYATPPVDSSGNPINQSYTFVLRLNSLLGNDIATYTITIDNQTLIPTTRVPVILNARPLTLVLNDTDPYYGYYIRPAVTPATAANMGTFQSGNQFAFKVIGYDFDGYELTYIFTALPEGLTGDSSTGWITGTPTIILEGVNQYNFGVSVERTAQPGVISSQFNFTFFVTNQLSLAVNWLTPSDLGTILNGVASTLSVVAEADVAVQYRITGGELPPNLTLLSNGEIVGIVADQPTDSLLVQGDTTLFTFTIQSFSDVYGVIESSRTFTVTVLQEFQNPTDTLYIKATPSLHDRSIIDSLLLDNTLIPESVLYRPLDSNFGKATSVIYEHAYGIYASNIDEYLAAVTRNHYWRNITLGELKTAVAKNIDGEVLYEVVYSEVVDNLINPYGISVSNPLYWPRLINLNLGPWYSSSTEIFTSWEVVLGNDYYTSLSPGAASTLYPNSLYNMRQRVSTVLGQEFNSNLLPLWMTSQQENGSTLGYTTAWVICYTKPGLANSVKSNIETNWNHTLNEINFTIDRFTVNKSLTYNYDTTVLPKSWDALPSATPVPDPIDSEDFYVLFPRKTILPNENQY